MQLVQTRARVLPPPTPCETLDQLRPGQKVHIKRVGGAGLLRRRLMDMGMVAGAEVEMVKTAPLGDPVEYRLCGYHLSLRKSEARCIEVE